MIKTLCMVKALLSWHNEKVARVCRERCGGGSYLEYNKVSEGVMGAHSGMTAEGDNSVLLQKVVKDILTHSRKNLHKIPLIKKSTITFSLR